jgi:hypothetical protein
MEVECGGGIVSTIFSIQQIFGCKFFLFTSSNVSHNVYILDFPNFIWTLPHYPYILNGKPQTSNACTFDHSFLRHCQHTHRLSFAKFIWIVQKCFVYILWSKSLLQRIASSSHQSCLCAHVKSFLHNLVCVSGITFIRYAQNRKVGKPNNLKSFASK